MAQNSIAKLSVQIIADTFGLGAGLNRAGQQTRQWADSVERGNNRLARLGKVGTDAARALSGLGGAGGLLIRLGGVAGPIGLAATAATALAVGVGRAAAASEDFRIEKLREIGRIGPEIKTTAEHMAELREQFTNFAELTGAGGVAKSLAADFRDAGKTINEFIFGEEKVAELMKKNAEARKAAELVVLKRRGDDLAKSLRTPMEVFGDTIGELLKLREEGFITHETMARGAAKAAEEYKHLAESVGRVREKSVGIPALEIGTAAARSAILSHGREGPAAGGADMREVAATLKRMEMIEREILKKPPVEFKKGGL
jgi:hypothetical protein